MGAADLDHVPEFFRLLFQLAVQFLKRGDEKILQLFRRADVHRRGITSLLDCPMLTWSFG